MELKLLAAAAALATTAGQDVNAINKAGSADSIKVAKAMEDLSYDSVVGPVRMRGEDHQLLLPQVVSTIAPVDGKTVKVGWEATNWGFRT